MLYSICGVEGGGGEWEEGKKKKEKKKKEKEKKKRGRWKGFKAVDKFQLLLQQSFWSAWKKKKPDTIK